MTTVNHFVKDCPNLNLLPSFLLHRSSLEVRVLLFHLRLLISILEIALANILRDVLVLKSTLEIALTNIHRDVLVLKSTLAIVLANILRDVLVLESTLAIVLANIRRDALVLFDVADVHQCNKVDFPYLLFFVCLLYDLLSFLFHCRFAFQNYIAWVERSFVCASGFPEACVSERQISRIF